MTDIMECMSGRLPGAEPSKLLLKSGSNPTHSLSVPFQLSIISICLPVHLLKTSDRPSHFHCRSIFTLAHPLQVVCPPEKQSPPTPPSRAQSSDSLSTSLHQYMSDTRWSLSRNYTTTMIFVFLFEFPSKCWLVSLPLRRLCCFSCLPVHSTAQ